MIYILFSSRFTSYIKHQTSLTQFNFSHEEPKEQVKAKWCVFKRDKEVGIGPNSLSERWYFKKTWVVWDRDVDVRVNLRSFGRTGFLLLVEIRPSCHSKFSADDDQKRSEGERALVVLWHLLYVNIR